MAVSRKQIGNTGEQIISTRLEEKGFVILDQNYYCAGIKGEIDIVAQMSDKIYFFEVRTRRGSSCSGIFPVMGRQKRARFFHACYNWIENSHSNMEIGGFYLALVVMEDAKFKNALIFIRKVI